MRSQFFLLTTAVILAAILFLVQYPFTYSSKFYAKELGKNFENEIVYIADHFNYSDIGDFVTKFDKYLNEIGYKIEYVCWTNANLNLPSCSASSKNCCHYFDANRVIEIDEYNIKLIPVKTWVCFEYNITNREQSYKNFFCT